MSQFTWNLNLSDSDLTVTDLLKITAAHWNHAKPHAYATQCFLAFFAGYKIKGKGRRVSSLIWFDVAHTAQWAELYLWANQKFRGLETPKPIPAHFSYQSYAPLPIPKDHGPWPLPYICCSGEGPTYSNCVGTASFAYRAVSNPIKQLNKILTAYN